MSIIKFAFGAGYDTDLGASFMLLLAQKHRFLALSKYVFGVKRNKFGRKELLKI